MSTRISVSIVMPAYNAVRHIEAVIGRVPDDIWPHIESFWIIDDGSSDGTAALIDNLAVKQPVIKPVHFRENRGYGSAVREGLRRCGMDGCEYAVCLHSDGQYAPESLPDLLRKAEADSVDILQGSRIASGTALSGGMPLYKYIAGKALTFFENIVFGLSMTDYHSGYLCYSRQALEKIDFDRLSTSFDFDLEVLASARARGLKIEEMPIPTRYADETSHLNPVTYGLRVLGIMAGYKMGKYRSTGGTS